MVFWKKQELHEDKLFLVLTQARSQVSRFWWEITVHFKGGKIVVFIICLKHIFSGHNNFWGRKIEAQCLPWLRTCANGQRLRALKVLMWGPTMRGVRRDEAGGLAIIALSSMEALVKNILLSVEVMITAPMA